jgi:hypothetical protein
MTKRNKTAPELEMLIYQRMQAHAVCHGVTAVTVEEGKGPAGSNWIVSDIYVPSGVVPQAVQNICDDAADDLRTQYDLMIEYELGEDESL